MAQATARRSGSLDESSEEIGSRHLRLAISQRSSVVKGFSDNRCHNSSRESCEAEAVERARETQGGNNLNTFSARSTVACVSSGRPSNPLTMRCPSQTRVEGKKTHKGRWNTAARRSQQELLLLRRSGESELMIAQSRYCQSRSHEHYFPSPHRPAKRTRSALG